MGHRWGTLKFAGICLVMLMVWCSAGVAATAPQSETVVPTEEQAAPEQKPPEKPPEFLPPIYYPGIVPYAPYTTTFAPSPSTGLMAPYGYGPAEDTLGRGWVTHPLGPVLVTPYLEYDGIYRSNVFETYNDKKSDFVNALDPGVKFQLPIEGGQHNLSVGYLGNGFIYSRYTDLSHYDNNVNGDASFNWSKLSVKFGSAFRAATEEPTATTGPPFLTAQERFYYRTTPYFSTIYKVADLWRIEGNYQFDNLSFPKTQDRIDDYQYNTAGATLFYKFWPKTSALLQYLVSFRNHPYDSGDNNTVQTPMVGLTWEPTAKLSGTVKVGYSFANYWQDLPGRNNFPDTWSMSVQTIYKITRYTQASLLAQRGFAEDVDYGNNPYITSGLWLTFSHFFHALDVTSYVSFAYYNNNYLNNTQDTDTGAFQRRNDNYESFGAGLSRPLTKWLRVRVDYLYENRGSNLSFASYNEHKVLAGLQTSF
jgi:hypothetical protein